ncbi:hypothetical protein [Paraburkholderia diazotrophica]|uniref:Uncharacterized protein n=1 Tax=Paraburkholderia diazotrophica TaxID=667676 RepID=A0A1H7EG34_9BURK|nr:hypothetical protein [Paraburkholderia diazotrophica]SEK12027.1 hypothetical protein SAMN05192539_105523 [Paraburkholderia diazotrophica]
MNDQRAIQFLGDIRKPLLVLHKAILDHERASYEKEFGPVTPAAFLQVLINGSGFRWLTPLSTVIANVDEILDNDEATSVERIAAVESTVGLFSNDVPGNLFLLRYRQILQNSPEILHAHGQVAPILKSVEGA